MGYQCGQEDFTSFPPESRLEAVCENPHDLLLNRTCAFAATESDPVPQCSGHGIRIEPGMATVPAIFRGDQEALSDKRRNTRRIPK